MVWDIVIPVATLLIGAAAGFFIGVFFLRKQLEKMQNDPEMIRKMAKRMGYHVNNQQMQQVQRMLNRQNQRKKRG